MKITDIAKLSLFSIVLSLSALFPRPAHAVHKFESCISDSTQRTWQNWAHCEYPVGQNLFNNVKKITVVGSSGADFRVCWWTRNTGSNVYYKFKCNSWQSANLNQSVYPAGGTYTSIEVHVANPNWKTDLVLEYDILSF
jgi:hypothetical protein